MVLAFPEDYPSVSWPTVHANVICASSREILLADHVIYLYDNKCIKYNEYLVIAEVIYPSLKKYCSLEQINSD